jgi:aminoglycoside 6'-N-acetyltransferase
VRLWRRGHAVSALDDVERLRAHSVTLDGRGVHVRPMTEEDWAILYRWNNDPEVLYYAEGDDVTGYSMQDMQALYRGVSRSAHCFVIEVDGTPVGECWLQHMNLDRIRAKYPGLDCRRIDLMLGEKDCWGRGIGTETIRLLTVFAFEEQGADVIYGPGIADYNVRSRRAFARNGYRLVEEVAQTPGSKAAVRYDVALTRAEYVAARK